VVHSQENNRSEYVRGITPAQWWLLMLAPLLVHQANRWSTGG